MDASRATRLVALFDAAHALPAGERPAFLARECGPDAELRSEVESLLTAGAAAPALLDRSPLAALLGNADLAGARIGAWELVREIGRGGMGAVHLARRADGQYEQLAAIKLVQPVVAGASREEIVRRFKDERQLLAALDHPHIARLLDGGTLADGTPWLAMEYVEGLPIDRYCAEHRLSRRRVLELFRDVCRAVAHAHSRLVAHRDLKPANILVTDPQRPGASPVPKLLDFGIAKLLGDPVARGGDPAATVARLTPAYASPEQFRGEPASAATDVYSLGVVLFELLTGRLPHDLAECAPHEIARRICDEPPRRPSALVPRLDRDLENVVLRALEKEPARRYASAAALADDLERHLTGHPVVARPASTAYRFWKTVQRHRLSFAIAAAAFVALATSSVWMSVLWRRALHSEANAEQRRSEAVHTANLFVDIFGAPDPFLRHGVDVTVVHAIEEGLPRLERELAGQPRVLTSIRWMAAQTLCNLDRYDRARAELTKTVAVLRELDGEESEQTVRAMNDLAVACAELRLTDEAIPLLRRVVELIPRIRAFDGDPKFELEVRQGLGAALSFAGKLDEAQDVLAATLARVRERLGPEAPLVVHVLGSLALVQRDRGDAEAARASSAEAVRVAVVAFGPDHPETLTAELGLAISLHVAREWDAAETLLRRLLPRLTQVFGPGNAHALSALRLLGKVCEQTGQADEARDHFTAAVEQTRAAYGDEHQETFDAEHDLCQFLCRRGEHGAAEQLARTLVDAATRSRGANDFNTLLYRFDLGASLRGSKRAAEAEEWLHDVVEAALDAGLPEELDLVDEARRGYAFALWDQGKHADAERPLLDSLEALLAAADAPAEQTAERIAERFDDVAALYDAWGRNDEARRTRERRDAWRVELARHHPESQ